MWIYVATKSSAHKRRKRAMFVFLRLPYFFFSLTKEVSPAHLQLSPSFSFSYQTSASLGTQQPARLFSRDTGLQISP